MSEKPTCDAEMATLKEFLFIQIGMNMILYTLYVFIKFVVLIQLLLLPMILDQIPSCCSKLISAMGSLVALVFGRPLGVVQRHEDEYRAIELDEEHKVPILYIRKTRLSYQAIELLTIIIASFFILALNSSLNASVLQVTQICSEDPKIHCYPVAIDPNDTIQNNITYSEEITDCAFWNSEGISSRVTFLCFRYKLSFDTFFTVFGGLTVVFTLTMKIASGTLLFVAEKRTYCCSIECFTRARIITATITLLAEYIIIFISLSFDINSYQEGTLLNALQKISPRVALVIGIVSTTLWLPWETYGSTDNRVPLDNRISLSTRPIPLRGDWE